MIDRTLEADYVIVGAGAAGMAFADTLLSDSDATMIIVDRRHKPGGHWNDAYPFVRLHGPSVNYGVNSRPLGSGRIDEVGSNRGLNELASGAEICAYFDQVMRQRLLPSGRVTWLPLSDVDADGVATSRIGGQRTRLHARRKTVDATFADTRVPATHPPAYEVAPGVRCVPPGALVDARESCGGFVVIGAGKTAIDTVVWLLEQEVAPEAITWIRPRDPWLLNRRHCQPTFEFFEQTIGGFAAEFEAARDATSVDDLFVRLEAAGLVRRVDPATTPTMYRCAIVSDGELELIRRVTRVVRMGRVTAIEPERIVLEGGTVPTTTRHVHVDCTADGIPRRRPRPIFDADRIVPQYVRRCSPTFSAAFVAHLEVTIDDDAQKNALCAVSAVPDAPADWLTNQIADARNALAWSKSPELQRWLAGARLDGFTAMFARAMSEPTPTTAAILQRYGSAIRPAIARMTELVRQETAAAARGLSS